MPKVGVNVLKYTHGEKSMKAQFILNADLGSFLEKRSTCHNKPEKSSTLLKKKYSFWLFFIYSLLSRCNKK